MNVFKLYILFNPPGDQVNIALFPILICGLMQNKNTALFILMLAIAPCLYENQLMGVPVGEGSASTELLLPLQADCSFTSMNEQSALQGFVKELPGDSKHTLRQQLLHIALHH